MSFRPAVFGKKAMARSLQASRWLAENPTATISEASNKFNVGREFVIRRMEKLNERRRCPICNLPLSTKRSLEKVNRYMDEYSPYLSLLMDSVRKYGSNLTNDEILELVHNSLIQGSTECQHSTHSQQV